MHVPRLPRCSTAIDAVCACGARCSTLADIAPHRTAPHRTAEAMSNSCTRNALSLRPSLLSRLCQLQLIGPACLSVRSSLRVCAARSVHATGREPLKALLRWSAQHAARSAPHCLSLSLSLPASLPACTAPVPLSSCFRAAHRLPALSLIHVLLLLPLLLQCASQSVRAAARPHCEGVLR